MGRRAAHRLRRRPPTDSRAAESSRRPPQATAAQALSQPACSLASEPFRGTRPKAMRSPPGTQRRKIWGAEAKTPLYNTSGSLLLRFSRGSPNHPGPGFRFAVYAAHREAVARAVGLLGDCPLRHVAGAAAGKGSGGDYPVGRAEQRLRRGSPPVRSRRSSSLASPCSASATACS